MNWIKSIIKRLRQKNDFLSWAKANGWKYSGHGATWINRDGRFAINSHLHKMYQEHTSLNPQ